MSSILLIIEKGLWLREKISSTIAKYGMKILMIFFILMTVQG